MKKILIAALLLFPVALMAQPPVESPFTEGIYSMKISIQGTMAPGQASGAAKTEQTIAGMSFEGYTIAYTAAVDAIREIVTKVWALENVNGLTEAKMQELMTNPRALFAE